MKGGGYQLLLGASGLLLGVMAALQVWALLAGGWPSLLPLRIAAFAAPFVAWALWARGRLRRGAAPWAARHASAAGVPVLVLALVVDALATGVESTVRHRMTWQVTPSAEGRAPQVELRFEAAPDHLVGLRSHEVAEYLGSADPVIDAEFVVTRDWGRLRSYRLARIGTLTRWRSDGGYAGCRGACEGSPF